MLLLEEEKDPEPGDKLQMGLRALCGQTSNYVDRGYIKVSFSFEAFHFEAQLKLELIYVE